MQNSLDCIFSVVDLVKNVTVDPCDEDRKDYPVNFNCTPECFLLHERGAQTQDLWDAVLMTLVYTFTFLAGIVGNSIVCIVIVRHSTMHTATNYYLFNLAVSDMVYLLFGLPFEVLLFWHQYPWLFGLMFCKFRALIAEACSYVSVLTIVAFSMERFLAICYPLHLYAMSGMKRAIRIIAAIWIISLLSATPFAYYRTINYVLYPPFTGTAIDDSGLCYTTNVPSSLALYETSTIMFFVIPMVIIFVLYAQIGIEIRSRSKQNVTKELGIQSNSINPPNKQSKSRRAIIKMLAVVVLTFFVSWAPFHAQRFVALYGKKWHHYQKINDYLFKISGFFYYFSCTINPIIYNMMSNRYRVAFKETLCGKKKHRLITTPRTLSRKTTSEPEHPPLMSQLSDPFDAETGAFSRTRSMRLSQSRMQRTASVQSKATSLKEPIEPKENTTIIT